MGAKILDINIEIVKREILKAVRGPRSQESVSQALGYKHNQVYRWEAGTKRILWEDFLGLCHACQVPVDKIFKDVYHVTQFDAKSILTLVINDLTDRQITEFLDVSIHTVRRWISGKTAPSFEHIILLLNQFTHSLPGFLKKLVPTKRLKILGPVIMRIEQERALNYNQPISSAIIRYLEIDRALGHKVYRSGTLARKFGISLSDEEDILSQLVEVGAIACDGEHFKIISKRLDTLGVWPDEKKIKLFWMDEARKSLASTTHYYGESEVFGYMIFTANDEVIHKVRERYLHFYQDALSLIHADESKVKFDKLRVMCFQLFDPIRRD